jgi:hypothetical protein
MKTFTPYNPINFFKEQLYMSKMYFYVWKW